MMWSCDPKCKADCCGPVMFPIALFEKHKPNIKVQYKAYEDSEIVFPVTEDLKCVFLENNKCIIYEDRPDVCKDYGTVEHLQCPHIKMNGNRRSPAAVKHMQREINHKIDYDIKKIGENVERKKKYFKSI